MCVEHASYQIAPCCTSPPVLILQDLYIGLHPPPASFILKMVTTMYTKTLAKLQHIMLLNPER